MTDDEAIAAVSKALGTLNATLRALVDNGIEVEIDTIDMQKFEDRVPVKKVMARLTRTKTEIDVRV